MKKDNLFNKNYKVQDFKFDQKVTEVFDEMLTRSVPFYDEIQRMVGELAHHFAQPGSNIYDLGCSKGTTMTCLAKKLKNKKVKIVGIDSSDSMLKEARARLKSQKLLSGCQLKKRDLNKGITLRHPSVVVMILTLQFVRPLQREVLIKNIYRSLKKGGALILFEKVLASDSVTNRLYIDLYYDFKKRNGYSELQIAQKREALENVLIPYTMDENKMLLRRNGFEVVDTFFNWYNFAGFMAVKN